MRRLKVGQIGITHEHAAVKMQALRQMTDTFEAVGVVDDRNTAATPFREVDDLKAYDGLPRLTQEELLAMQGLDAVLVETSNHDLVPTAVSCMRRNLHIHMDKPGGEDLSEFLRLVEGCRQANLVFQVGYMFRNNPAMQFAIEAVRDHWLGDIFEIQASMSHNYGGEPYQTYLRGYKGGIMYNLGCHLIDLVVTLMGRPVNVMSCLKSAPGYEPSIKNNCLTVIDYPHATATLRACSKEVDGLNKRSLKICGTRGTIELSPLERFDGQPLQMKLTLRAPVGEYSAGAHTLHFDPERDRYQGQLLEFAQIIRGEKDNPYSYEHEALVNRVVLAASECVKWID